MLLLFFETMEFNVYLCHFNVLTSVSYWSLISAQWFLPLYMSGDQCSWTATFYHQYTDFLNESSQPGAMKSESLSVKTKLEDNCCAEILPSYICCSLTPRLSQHAVSLWITAALTGLWTQQQSVPERLRAAATGVITSPPSHVEWIFMPKWTAPLE